MTAIDLLQYAASKNIYHVQFGDNMPLHLFSDKDLRELKETKDFLGIHVEVGTRRLDVENINQYISIAKCLQSPFLRVVIDDENYHPAVEEVKKIIKQVLPVLKDENIILAIENHDRFSAKSLAEIIEATDPDRVAICLDTANSIGAGEGINEVLAILAPYTINLHAKDFTIKRVAHKMGFVVEGCVAGDGCVDIPSILQSLKPYGRCKTATLEVWSNPLQTIDETIKREQQWVEKSIQYLKQIIQ